MSVETVKAGAIAGSPVKRSNVPLLGIHVDLQTLLAQTTAAAVAFAIDVHVRAKTPLSQAQSANRAAKRSARLIVNGSGTE